MLVASTRAFESPWVSIASIPGRWAVIFLASATNGASRERRVLWMAAAAGVALVALFDALGLLEANWWAAWRQLTAAPSGLIDSAGKALAATMPQLLYGWALLLPIAPLLAALADLLRDKRPGEEERARARDEERRSDQR